MKKVDLNLSKPDSPEVLTKDQLKNVLGGEALSGTGGEEDSGDEDGFEEEGAENEDDGFDEDSSDDDGSVEDGDDDSSDDSSDDGTDDGDDDDDDSDCDPSNPYGICYDPCLDDPSGAGCSCKEDPSNCSDVPCPEDLDCGAGESPSIVSNLYNQSAFSSSLQSLTSNISNNNFEKTFSLTVFNDGSPGTPYYTPTSISQGNPGGQVNLITNLPYPNTVVASVHTHPAGYYAAPSAGDLYSLAEGNSTNSSYATVYTIGPDGTGYSLTIQNAALLSTFLSSYPKASNLSANGSFGTGTLLGDEIQDAFDYLTANNSSLSMDDAYAQAFSTVLSAFDTGVVLTKMDSSTQQFNNVYGNDNDDGTFTGCDCL
jgi:hypothetical protein